MPIEPKDLTEARMLLSKFEVEIERSEGLVHLSEALSLLANVATDATFVELKQTCANVASAYARKVQAKVQLLLTQEPLVDWETEDHLLRVFSEFERSGLALPSAVTECHSELFVRKIEYLMGRMSPAERERYLLNKSR
jgi:hypothetical protein